MVLPPLLCLACTFCGFEHQDPEILPIGVVFFRRFFFLFPSIKKKKKEEKKSIGSFLLLDWLEETCGSCSSNRRGLLTSTLPFFPLFFTHPAHIYTHQPLSRQSHKLKKTKQNKSESKVSARGTTRGFKEREREQGERTNNGSRFLLQGEEERKSHPEIQISLILCLFL